MRNPSGPITIRQADTIWREEGATRDFDRVLFGHGAEVPDPLGALRSMLRGPQAGRPD